MQQRDNGDIQEKIKGRVPTMPQSKIFLAKN